MTIKNQRSGATGNARTILLGVIVLAMMMSPWPASGNGPVEMQTVSLARYMLAKSGMTHGIAVLPRCDDPSLAVALAQNSQMLVQAMSADPRVVDALVQRADTEGLLSRWLYVASGTPAAMPFADNLVDLALITDLADADLPLMPVEEMVRVLAPWRGQVIAGRAKGSGKGALTRSALAGWAKADAATAGEIWEDETGLWVRLRKSPLAGAQGWTHRFHGPNNDAASQDTTLHAPLLTQWLGLPLHEGWWGTTVVGAGGRLFTFRSGRGEGERKHHTLVARSAYNGMELWRRELGAYNSARCCAVATPGRLFMIDGDGVLLLKTETGVECGRIAGPKPGGQVKWIAVSDRVLVLLTGEKDELKDVNLVLYPTQPNGTLLAAYDLDDHKLLWKHEEKQPIDERMVAAHQGWLYAYATNARAFCLNLKTGRLRWENADPALRALVDQGKPAFFWIPSQKGLCVAGRTLLLDALRMKKWPILSTENGALLCVADKNGQNTGKCFPFGGEWILNNQVIDVTTGKPSRSVGIVFDSCAQATAAPGFWIGGFGTCVDQSTGRIVACSESKSPCDIGTVVSDGMIVTPASVCRCNFQIPGYRVLAAGRGEEVMPPAKPETRLVRRPAASPSAFSILPADWPTYRANNARTGSTPVRIPATMAKRWTWSPAKPVRFVPAPTQGVPPTTTDEPEYSATPPICAAGRIWLGDAGGMIRCLNAADGRLLWSFPTGAIMSAPPTVAEGRLYAGAGNGWIYCLNAATGEELWRFQAAPHDRQIMWYGHLSSTWPVLTGVLVHEGAAYAVAGHQALNGVYVYALDAATGQLRWRTSATEGQPDLRFAPSVMGGLTIAGGRLWLSSGTDCPASFDLKTGVMPEPVKSKLWPGARPLPPRGSGIGCLAGHFLLFGGRRLVSTYDERFLYPAGLGITLVRLNASGLAQPPADFLLPLATQTPVWDQELLVLTHCHNSQLYAWNVSKLITFLDEQAAANSKLPCFTPPEFQENVHTRPVPAANFEKAAMHLWSKPDAEVTSLALAGNALVAAYKEKTGPWLLAGFHRDTGAALWSQKLPCEPIFDALCISRDGQIIIGLRDGSVIGYDGL